MNVSHNIVPWHLHSEECVLNARENAHSFRQNTLQFIEPLRRTAKVSHVPRPHLLYNTKTLMRVHDNAFVACWIHVRLATGRFVEEAVVVEKNVLCDAENAC